MDKEYIQRLQDMLDNANAKIASLDEIQDPQERMAKKTMFLESKKEIEELLKKAGGSTKSSKAKKSLPKKAAKKPAKPATKKVVKKTPAKKATKSSTKKATKPVAKKAPAKATKKVVKKAVTKKPTTKKAVKKSASKKPATKKTTKPAVKKVSKKPAAKKPIKKATKPATKKPVAKKTTKPATKKATKEVVKKAPAKKVSESANKVAIDAAVIGDESKSFKQQEKEIAKVEAKQEKETRKEAKEVFESKEFKETKTNNSVSLKEQKKQEKLAAKQAKQEAKEYKKSEKLANKRMGKVLTINGSAVPEYSDDIAKIRDINNIPAFGSKHEPMTEEELILNTRYASMFYFDADKEANEELKNHKLITVEPYNDANYHDEVAQYKDSTKTPTAKIGVQAGPLENGPVAINPNDEADKVSPNDSSIVEKTSKAKNSKKADSKVIDAVVIDDSKSFKKQEKEIAKEKAKQEKATKKEAKGTFKKEAPKENKPSAKELKKQEKLAAKEAKRKEKEAAKLAKQQEKEAQQRELEMKRKQEEDKLKEAKAKADKTAAQQKAKDESKKAKEAEINKLADEASAKAAKQAKEDAKKQEKAQKEAAKNKKELAEEQAHEKKEAIEDDKRTAEQRERASKRADIEKGEFIKVDLPPIPDDGVKSLKQIAKRQKQLTSKYSKQILEGAIVTTTDYKPEVSKHVIELHNVVKSYITGDVETPVLKGIDIKLDKGDFIVILGPSGSGKTTFLNTISGLDKATKGDVFVLGYNLSYLKDSHLTKFRRKHVGFIFQQYNLLTNLTAKENAEVGENLSTYKNPDMTIEDIFDTIGMKTQMNKYPHQMSGGQQQRVSIARALAKNPDILFADEPTGALDEEMGRKVLEILVEVNKRYGTTVIVVTHNPNIAKIGNTVIHIKNGLIDQVEKNKNPEDPSTIEWS